MAKKQDTAGPKAVKAVKMKLSEYLEGMRQTNTATELESAIQAPFKHSFHGRTWTTICKTRIERGAAICADHPNGQFVPSMKGRSLTVCGETYGVGRGGNSTGVRYVWHSAGEFVKDVLKRNGFSQRAACRIWDCWRDYPHRCLDIIADALSGKFLDPVMNRLSSGHKGHSPINMTVEANDADELDRRATLPCKCGGTLFDWGAGFSDDFTFVNWHCNGCSNVYTEYVTPTRFAEIRQPIKVLPTVAPPATP